MEPVPAAELQFWRRLSRLLGPGLALLGVIAFFAAAEVVVEYARWQREPESASLGAFFSHYERKFLTSQNFRTVAVQTSTVAVAALGMTVVIVAGGIDLSAGTAIALCATVIAAALKGGWSPAVAVLAGLTTGVLCGLINGVLIGSLRVVPFIVTLGTMSMYLGLAKWIGNDTTVRPKLEGIPDWMLGMMKPIPQPDWLLMPSGVWLALAMAAVLGAVMRWSVFGRYVYALGSNEATARLCGINVTTMKIRVYGLAGFFVGMAGLYQFARLASGNPTSGSGLELRIIAAVVIGGASLHGGRGTLIGTLVGTAIMGVISSGCTMLGVDNRFQDMILGAIIIIAVTVDQYRQRRLAALAE